MSYLQGQDWDPIVLKKTPKNNTISNKKTTSNTNTHYEEDVEKKPIISLNNSQLIQNGRKNVNLTQKQLAQKLSIDSKIIQEYESGKTAPDYKIMCRLEKILKISLNKKKSQ